MPNAYQTIYGGYRKYCSTVGVTPLSFGQWMSFREYVTERAYRKRQRERRNAR